MFQFMLVVGLVLAYYGYAVTKNPRIWGDQGRDAIKEENWNRYVRYNGQFAMYAGFLMAALGALDMAVNLSTAIYLLILLGGFLFHTIWEANSRYIFVYSLLLMPYCAAGIHDGLVRLAAWRSNRTLTRHSNS